jgi:Holliday junction resolvase
MVDVITPMKPCSSCSLQTSASLLKKGLCNYCRPATIQAHNKELAIKALLEAQLGHIDFVHDRVTEAILECACRKYRPDFWAELPTFVLVIEVDEHQHEQYEPSCELRRLVELLVACMGKPLVVIRYNPDAYMIQGETQRTSTKKRQAALIDRIQKYENNYLDKILTVEYMFYTDLRQAELETELATQLQAYVSAGE